MKSRFFSIAVVILTASAGLAPIGVAREKQYTVEDLKALVKSESWSELFSTVRDIPPAKRDAEWNTIVEQMAVGMLAAEGLPERRASMVRDLTAEFPHLKNSKAVAEAGPKNPLADVEKCFGERYSTEQCFENLTQIVAVNKKNGDLPLDAAALVARYTTPLAAIEFYLIAVDRGNQKKVCAHDRISESVISGLKLPKGKERASAVKLAETCWPELKESLVTTMGKESTDGYYWEALCPTALKKKALTGLKEKSCRKHLDKSAEKSKK